MVRIRPELMTTDPPLSTDPPLMCRYPQLNSDLLPVRGGSLSENSLTR